MSQQDIVREAGISAPAAKKVEDDKDVSLRTLSAYADAVRVQITTYPKGSGYVTIISRDENGDITTITNDFGNDTKLITDFADLSTTLMHKGVSTKRSAPLTQKELTNLINEVYKANK